MPDGIKDAILIYNPTSGGNRHRRFSEVEQAARILKDEGIATELAPTTARASATQMARDAVAQRRGMVIVCGGDGTINEVVNGMAGSQVPMALLPAGTANILAKELGIPWDIPHAARLIRGGTVRRIALGLVETLNGNHTEHVPPGGRYFLCVAGAGPDGAIVNGVDEELKKRAGHHCLLDRGRSPVLQLRFSRDENPLGLQGTARHICRCRAHGALWGPVQDHYRREPLRRLVRDPHKFQAQPLRLPDLSARAVARQAPRA